MSPAWWPANTAKCMKQRRTVSLVYGYSARNAGDFAITLGAVDVLARSGFHVRLFSRYCAKNKDFFESSRSLRERYGDELEIFECPFNLDRADGMAKTAVNYLNGILTVLGIRRRKAFRQSLLGGDLVIFNGGNLFRCRSFIDLARLAALLYPLSIAKKAHKPYVIFPQSASTLNGTGKRLLLPILKGAETVMFREEETAAFMSKMVDLRNVFQTIDLAFFIDKTHLPETPKDYSGYVALTLRFHTVGDIAYLPGEKQEKILQTVGGLIEKVKPERPVLLVVQSDKDEELSRKIASTHRIELIKCQDVPKLLSIYRQVDLLIGMRLHSIILALSTGTPCIGLFYKEWGLKNPGMMKYFGLPCHFFDEGIDSTRVFTDLEKLLASREETKQLILSIVNQEQQDLYERIARFTPPES